MSRGGRWREGEARRGHEIEGLTWVHIITERSTLCSVNLCVNRKKERRMQGKLMV